MDRENLSGVYSFRAQGPFFVLWLAFTDPSRCRELPWGTKKKATVHNPRATDETAIEGTSLFLLFNARQVPFVFAFYQRTSLN